MTEEPALTLYIQWRDFLATLGVIAFLIWSMS